MPLGDRRLDRALGTVRQLIERTHEIAGRRIICACFMPCRDRLRGRPAPSWRTIGLAIRLRRGA